MVVHGVPICVVSAQGSLVNPDADNSEASASGHNVTGTYFKTVVLTSNPEIRVPVQNRSRSLHFSQNLKGFLLFSFQIYFGKIKRT